MAEPVAAPAAGPEQPVRPGPQWLDIKFTASAVPLMGLMASAQATLAFVANARQNNTGWTYFCSCRDGNFGKKMMMTPTQQEQEAKDAMMAHMATHQPYPRNRTAKGYLTYV